MQKIETDKKCSIKVMLSEINNNIFVFFQFLNLRVMFWNKQHSDSQITHTT